MGSEGDNGLFVLVLFVDLGLFRGGCCLRCDLFCCWCCCCCWFDTWYDGDLIDGPVGICGLAASTTGCARGVKSSLKRSSGGRVCANALESGTSTGSDAGSCVLTMSSGAAVLCAGRFGEDCDYARCQSHPQGLLVRSATYRVKCSSRIFRRLHCKYRNRRITNASNDIEQPVIYENEGGCGKFEVSNITQFHPPDGVQNNDLILTLAILPNAKTICFHSQKSTARRARHGPGHALMWTSMWHGLQL